MPEEECWNWIECAFKRLQIPYPLISLILFIISFLVYLFLSKRVECFPDPQDWDIYTRMQILSTCFLIAYEAAGVRYFIDNMREVIKIMKSVPGCEQDIIDLNSQLEAKFSKSKLFYIVAILVVAPFIVIDPLRGEFYLFSMYGETITIWSILLDIFNYLITIFVLYLMAVILWIIFNISWALNKIERSYPEQIIKIDLFDADKVGGLKPIRDLVLKLVVFQFIAISLGIISFLTPYEIIYHEIIFLSLIFLITVYFFVAGWYTIHKLLEGERTRTINSINDLYLRQNQRMHDIVSCDDYSDKKDELDLTLKSMEFLHDERVRVIHSSKRAYDLKALFIFISSSLIPLITKYLLPLLITAESDGYGQVFRYCMRALGC